MNECGTNIALALLRARSPKSERALGKALRKRGKYTTCWWRACLHPNEAMYDGRGKPHREGIRGVRGVLPDAELAEGQNVVVDTFNAHKGDRVREMVKAKSASLVFLPSYSPDVSHIEEAFNKFKTILRIAPRTKEALRER